MWVMNCNAGSGSNLFHRAGGGALRVHPTKNLGLVLIAFVDCVIALAVWTRLASNL